VWLISMPAGGGTSQIHGLIITILSIVELILVLLIWPSPIQVYPPPKPLPQQPIKDAIAIVFAGLIIELILFIRNLP
jgi:hypothetical protein